MNRNEAITALVNYALEKELIEQEEKVWAVNRILEVMQADSFSWEESAKGKEAGLTEILDTLIDDAYERGVLELSVQSGHELYPKGQSCERYPLEDRDRIW